MEIYGIVSVAKLNRATRYRLNSRYVMPLTLIHISSYVTNVSFEPFLFIGV